MPPKRSAGENALVTNLSEKSANLKAALEKERNGLTPTSDEAQTKKDIDIVEHLMTTEEVIEKYKTNVGTGLTNEEHKALLLQHGKNCLTPPKKTPMILVFLGHMTGFFSLLLWAACILCFIAYGLSPVDVENMYLGCVLAGVTILTGVFSFYQDYQSAAAMAGFANMLPPRTNVLREGEECMQDADSLVPGDIVTILGGNKIPADIRVISASNFKVDNSSLTGESLALKREATNTRESPLEATNIIFFGSLATAGSCQGVVIKTGDHTVIGDIARLTTSQEGTETPIAKEIHHFILIISCVAIVLGVSFLIIGWVIGLPMIQNLVFGIGIIVANVPEGLLATVTVSLTLTSKRMAKKKVLVKNLEAVETLGSTTVIASDKTGTLTQNIMTVKHLFYDGKVTDSVHGISNSFDPKNPSFDRLRLVAALCNNAKFDKKPENLALEVQRRVTIGDASESALLKFCEVVSHLNQTSNVDEQRLNNNKLAEIPFTSANKYQVSVHMMNNNLNENRIVVMKGAPERIRARCDYTLIDGKPVPILTPTGEKDASGNPIMEDAHLSSYEKDIQGLMETGERVLGFAYIELNPTEFPEDFVYDTDAAEDAINFPMRKGQGLVFAGLISMQDPPRPAVPKAVEDCQAAGIRVIMVTGDHPDTAEAIARDVHIITNHTIKTLKRELKATGKPFDEPEFDDIRIKAVVITTDQLKAMSDTELDYYLDFDEIVFARTSPAQKLRIVRALQDKKQITRGRDVPLPVANVVAVTGDGVNDSPALKAADIGVAMGIVGSDVAKDAADMVLLNDNFANIVKGVEEGRLIFDNLKKSIAYTLSSNIPEISPFLIFILIQIPLPLPTVLILCIDLGTDMIPAISLAYEYKESNIMQKPPRDMRVDRLVTTKLINFSYLQIGVVQAAAGFYSYVVVLQNFGFPANFLMGKAKWFMKDSNSTVFASAAETGLECANLDMSWTHPVMQFCGMNEQLPCECAELGPCAFDATTESLCHNNDYSLGALQHAQCAFFIAIIVVQWADLVICKTRNLSIFEQGMRNNTLNFGLFFTTVLGSILCYVPMVPLALGTAPLHFVHWCPAMPFCIMIFLYDEVRKSLIRNNPTGWVFKNTYY